MWESENQDESPLMTTDNFHGIDGLGVGLFVTGERAAESFDTFDVPLAGGELLRLCRQGHEGIKACVRSMMHKGIAKISPSTMIDPDTTLITPPPPID
jgi:hypothetical protein